MSPNIDFWEWTYADYESFSEEGGLKKAIIDYYEEFWRCYEDDPAGAELAINQAIDAARACGEVRWELHLRHWRIQNWLVYSQARRALPEAIDLLSLAVDERVQDIPQRLCAYHDVVECYVKIDPAGYGEEIKENSTHILSQIPKRYPCADCARGNLARAAAAAGNIAEAEHWLAEDSAHSYEALTANVPRLNGRGDTYVRMHQWDNAERIYRQASQIAGKRQQGLHYLKALLGLARVRIGKGDLAGAQQLMPRIRSNARYEGGSNLAARLMEVEGYMAEAHKVPQAALNYFTRSAKIYDELGCTRDAAEIALHAAELARAHELPEPEEALALAARTVGTLPPTSQDLYQRLADLGREPLTPTTEQTMDAPETAEGLKEQEDRKELANLEEMLQAHLQSGLYQGITSTLFSLAVWHDTHNQARAALDYFIWAAALERLRGFPRGERAGALEALKHLSKKMPAGTFSAALRAAESAPPTRLLPMLTNLPLEEWRWTLQAIATEVMEKPVVEPRPASKENRASFEEWLEHYASMSILLVRFREQADPAKCEAWAGLMDDFLQLQQANAATIPPEQHQGFEAFTSLVQGLSALARGATIEEVQQSVAEPFKQIVMQIGKSAQEPVWQHPGNSPLDLMIEHMAQKAVQALRRHDRFRASRLAALAFRFELMTIDMREPQELANEVRFLEALAALVSNDGQPLPAGEQALAEPYATILAAVAQAGLEVREEEQEGA